MKNQTNGDHNKNKKLALPHLDLDAWNYTKHYTKQLNREREGKKREDRKE